MNFILGQAHFIKTVEDLHEAIVTTAPHLKFGLAFCESSGPSLVRYSWNDAELVELAKRNALALAAGHAFIIFLKDGFPVNILNTVKGVPEVCRVFCATANPVEVVVAETEQGRASWVSWRPQEGDRDQNDIRWRKDFLRRSATVIAAIMSVQRRRPIAHPPAEASLLQVA
jgi:adenosine/AMP kinase